MAIRLHRPDPLRRHLALLQEWAPAGAPAPAHPAGSELAEGTDSNQVDWLQPPPEQEGLARYLETIRERGWLIVICVVITTAVALLYVATATKMYEAEADLLVTPINSADSTLGSLGLIQASTD